MGIASEYPLSGHAGFHALRAEELCQPPDLDLRAGVAELPTRNEPIGAIADKIELPNSELWVCHCGVPTSLAFPEPDFVLVQFQYEGGGRTCNDGPKRVGDFPAEVSQIVWRVQSGLLSRKLATLTGQLVGPDLAFAHTVALDPDQAVGMCALVGCILQLAALPPSACSKLVLRELEGGLILSFLFASKHRLSEKLHAPNTAIAPWQVRRAEGIIEANWMRALSIDDLARMVGVSARSLFRAFRVHRGYSPMEFARNVRLDRAAAMLAGAKADSVTEVALTCGFSDFGRFSRDFARRFGERPSAVLQRSKNVSQPVGPSTR